MRIRYSGKSDEQPTEREFTNLYFVGPVPESEVGEVVIRVDSEELTVSEFTVTGE